MAQRITNQARSNGSRSRNNLPHKRGHENSKNGKRGLIYLALAGGGVGALGFEVGGLCALERILNPGGPRHVSKLNDLINGYQGVSAGAIISTLMAIGFSPHTIRDVMLEHSRVFPPLKRDALGTQPIMYFSLAEQVSRGLIRTVRSVIEGLLRLDLPSIWPLNAALRASFKDSKRKLSFSDMRLLADLVRLGAFEQASVNNFMHNVLDTMQGGLYTTSGIGEYIREVIHDYTQYTDNFSSLNTELYVYAAELNSSQVRVFGTQGEHLPYELIDAPISKTVELSCAIPVFFKPVYLEQTNSFYVDGGVIKSLHLQNVIDRVNYIRPSQKVPAIILTFFPFVPPIYPVGSDYAHLSLLELLSFSLKMTYLEKFNTALRSYRHEEENNIHIQIFKPSRHSKTARTHPLQDITLTQIAQLNYEGEVSVYRAFLNDYDRFEQTFRMAGMEIAPREEIAVLLKTCRAYYGIGNTSGEEVSSEAHAPEIPGKRKKR
jgi:predicted acylesterase/phospholipase RssA